MLHAIHPDNPDQRKVKIVAEILEKGGVIIYPTDTVYSLGCSLMNKRAIERLAKLKNVKLKHANFSIIFYDLSHLADYTKAVDRATYKILNKNLRVLILAVLKHPSFVFTNFEVRLPELVVARII